MGDPSGPPKRRTLRRLAPVALLLGIPAAFIVLHCVRAARDEASLFRPPRDPIVVPPALAGVELRDATFEAAGSIAIRGWYTPSKNRAAVLLAHGSGANRAQLATEMRALHDNGFGVLAFDLPGHGESGGIVEYGAGERAALRAAMSFLEAQPEVDPRRLGAFGFSIGASLVAMDAPEDPRMRAIVLLSPFADSDEQTRNQFGRWRPIVGWPAVWVDHWFMPEAPLRPVDAVRGLQGRDLLIIVSSNDGIVPAWMSERVYDAATARKELLVVPHEGHGGFDALAPGVYGERLVAFFRRTLLGNGGS